MTEPRGDVPAELTAQTVIHPDGAAEVALGGVVERFAAQDMARVAGNITEYIAERAAADGRPVRVDVRDPDGEWLLVVHPDGTVEETGPTTRVRRRHSDPETGVVPQVPAPEDDGARGGPAVVDASAHGGDGGHDDAAAVRAPADAQPEVPVEAGAPGGAMPDAAATPPVGSSVVTPTEAGAGSLADVPETAASSDTALSDPGVAAPSPGPAAPAAEPTPPAGPSVRVPVVRPPTGAIPLRGVDTDTVLMPAVPTEPFGDGEAAPEPEPEPVPVRTPSPLAAGRPQSSAPGATGSTGRPQSPVPGATASAAPSTPVRRVPARPSTAAAGVPVVTAGPAGAPGAPLGDGQPAARGGTVQRPVSPVAQTRVEPVTPTGTPAWNPVDPGPGRDDVDAGPARTPDVSGPPRTGAAGSAPTSGTVGLPTLDDLLATRPAAPAGPAQRGWQATVRRLTGGLVAPVPGPAELEHRSAVSSVQRSLNGPKTVVVVNPKGGAHKTTATLLVAATFGIHRGGYTLAWDNNETRGTLGWRSTQGRHSNTAVNLLQDLDRFADPGSARVGDLDNYVRSQGSAQFDVLASDEDAASAASIDAEAFTALHRTLARFYRVMVIDTGNNMRASNWQAAVAAADQLVIVSTVREDTAQSAAWAVDALRATGHDDAVRHAVTVLSAPSADVDEQLRARLHGHFDRLTRVVLDVPHDSALVAGGPLVVDALAPATREAWLRVTAAVADGL